MSQLRSQDCEVRSAHLDDDVFAELTLGGEVGAEGLAHLEVCLECREELVRFQESVRGFGLASLAWSEAKSESLDSRARERRAALRMYPALSWTLAALLLLGVGIPVKMHYDGVHDLHAANGGAANLEGDDDPLNSPEQIAKDNQLMAAVHFELSRSEASLLERNTDRRSRAGRLKARNRTERELQ